MRSPEFPDDVVERAEHRFLRGREEFHSAVDASERNAPTDREGAHRQQIGTAGLVAHCRGRLVEHRNDVNGLFPQGLQALAQGQHLFVNAQLQASVRDLLLDLVAILAREPAGTDESGFVVGRGGNLD